MTTRKRDHLITLEEFIIQSQNRFPGATGDLSQLLRDIGLAAKIISREVNKAGITNILGEEGTENVHGEPVKKLDIFANDQLISALNRADITCMVISEENNGIVKLSADAGKYIVYMDPLDGSSNIDVNVSIGSIFSIYMRDTSKKDLGVQDALQPGVRQVAAGYVLYGSSTIMVYTTGLGVTLFTLDPSIGEFILCSDDIEIPDRGSIYSVNEGSYNSWSLGLKKYIKYCQVDEEGGSKRPYKARYIGSMVADIHRTLLKGGIFIYPHSAHYPSGKLRLMYESNPLSFIIEQAGGLAINGKQRIMEITPKSIHQRSPIYIGSKKNVKKVREYLLSYETAEKQRA